MKRKSLISALVVKIFLMQWFWRVKGWNSLTANSTPTLISNLLFYPLILSLALVWTNTLLDFSKAFYCGVGVADVLHLLYSAASPFPTLLPKGESPQCYKLASREHHKWTNKLSKVDTTLDPGQKEPKTPGPRDVLHSPLYDWQSKTEGNLTACLCPPGPGTITSCTGLHLLLARLGKFPLGGLYLPVFWV